jgi:hypothetical protein
MPSAVLGPRRGATARRQSSLAAHLERGSGVEPGEESGLGWFDPQMDERVERPDVGQTTHDELRRTKRFR